MKRILVATDFAANATNAMEYAMELARVLKAEVTAIHAIGSFEGIFNSTYNALYIDDYYNNKRVALQKWAYTFTAREEYSTVSVTTTCEVGAVSSVISKYIETNPTEMLVMGTMGSTGITGLFGSNASALVEKIKIPMLIVPLESKFSVDPTITLATDFELKLSGVDVEALNEMVLGFRTHRLNVLNIVE